MFISVSAKVQDFEWFEYKSNRKTVLDNHHKEYDLELEKGIKFGIRTFRKKLRLVVSDDLSIPFTISERELSSIKRKATPFKGKVNGVVVHTTELLDDSLYHELNLPPTKKELINLYNHYNKKLFDDKCLPLADINFSRSKRVVAWATFLPKVRKAKMKFNTSYLKSNPKYIIDTLIHEMIHCYQYGLMFDAWDKMKASDDASGLIYRDIRDELTPVTRKDSKGNRGTGGHGKIFKAKMHKLNALGYDITVEEHGTELIDMHNDHYVLLFFSRENLDEALIGGYAHNVPFKDSVQDIIKQLQKLYGPTFAVRYMYGNSKHSFTTQTVELTSDGSIPTNIKFKWYGNANRLKALQEFKPEEEGHIIAKDNPALANFQKQLTTYANKKYTWTFSYYALNVMYYAIPGNDRDEYLMAYNAGNDNRLKTMLQDQFPTEYKLLVEEYNHIDLRKLIKSRNKEFNNIVDFVWKTHKWLESGDYNDPTERYHILDRLHDEWKFSPFLRADKDEFAEMLTKKIKREYPIPAKQIEMYVDHVMNDKG